MRVEVSPGLDAILADSEAAASWLLRAQAELLDVPACDFVIGVPDATERREEAGGRTVVLPLPGGPKCYCVGETAPDPHIRFCLAEEY